MFLLNLFPSLENNTPIQIKWMKKRKNNKSPKCIFSNCDTESCYSACKPGKDDISVLLTGCIKTHHASIKHRQHNLWTYATVLKCPDNWHAHDPQHGACDLYKLFNNGTITSVPMTHQPQWHVLIFYIVTVNFCFTTKCVAAINSTHYY